MAPVHKPQSVKDIKVKLERYRAQKAASEFREKWGGIMRSPWQLLMTEHEEEEEELEMETPQHLLDEGKGGENAHDQEEVLPQSPLRRTLSNWRVQLSLWLVCWCAFIFLEFGAIFLIVSILVWLWRWGLRSSKKVDAGPSAYSVFNENCERLQGTFSGEDFDASLRSGLGMVNPRK